MVAQFWPLKQAAVPAILTGLYKYSTSDEGAAEILRGNSSTNWVDKIFDEGRKEAIEKIVAYADQSKQNPLERMNAIANEAIRLAKENLKATAGIKEVKDFFSNQVNNILPYLPAALYMGDVLGGYYP